MKNFLNIPVDDHYAKIIIRALREQAKRDKGIYKTLATGLAEHVEKLMLKYQAEQAAILTELRGVKKQIAAAIESKEEIT